jgi:predicted MFS family arabinose efflux permease
MMGVTQPNRTAAPPHDDRRRTPLLALYAANAISLAGNIMAFIAVPWFVLQMTGSPAQTGLAAFFSALPIVIAAFFGGTIVDRLGYRRTSILADLSSGITVALIPLLYHTVGLAFWQLLVLVFVGNFLDAPGSTARQALVPDLAQLARVRLEQASAASDGISRGARLLGAPLAGVLIVVLGPSNILWVDAATFAWSALLIALAVPPRPAPPAASRSYLAELRAGMQFIGRDRLLRALIGTVMVTNFLDAALGSVIYPVYVRQVFGSPVNLGLLIGVFGGAALLGTLIFGAVGYRWPRRAAFAGGFIITGLRFWVLALFPPLSLLLAAQTITGLAVGPINPIISTVTYERIPEGMRARVFGTITAGVTIAVPLSVLVTGYLLEWLGLRPLLLVLGTGYMLTTGSLLVNPAIHELNTHSTQQRAPDTNISA